MITRLRGDAATDDAGARATAPSLELRMRCHLILICLGFLVQGSAQAQLKRTLTDPDALAGRWETSDGHGGAVGMNVIVTTHMGASNSVDDHAQYEDEFTIGLYQRTDPEVGPHRFNFFSSTPGEGTSWDGHRLTIHLLRTDIPKVNIDLTWHEESPAWNGLFERGAFREQVSLKRPSSKASASPFVGTWSDPRGLMNNCLHIAQQADGALAAWSDDIQVPGRVRYANGIQPPAQMLQHYGEIARAEVDTHGQINVELRAYTAMCCSHRLTAKLSADDQLLSGAWLAGPNQAPRSVEWKRMPGISCLAVTTPDVH